MTKYGNVFITGANRGIGLGLVKEFAKQSDVQNIFAGCRDPSKAKELSDLQKVHPSIKIIQIDVQNDSTIKSAVTEVERILGPNTGLNILINNAAIAEKYAALNHYTRALACDEPTLVAISVCPGWVRTDMGGSDAFSSVEESTSALLNLIASLDHEKSGNYFSHEGKQLEF
ncbi:short chain dehydrogenase domain-containing protein [Ditylenchus destructor]|nr:short chain dehydrogenase domain-containing protein [Ditylenchus destructor]